MKDLKIGLVVEERNSKGQFIKGFTPWNKGMVGFGKLYGFKVHHKTRNTGRTRFKKGHIPWNFHKLSPKVSGEKSNFWRGGVTEINRKIRHSARYLMWRYRVFKRDNWTCQRCGQRGGYLEPHHIKSFNLFSDLRFKVSNGRTLCRECHKRTFTYLNRQLVPQTL